MSCRLGWVLTVVCACGGCAQLLKLPPPLKNPLLPLTLEQLGDPPAATGKPGPTVAEMLVMMSDKPQDFDRDGRYDGYVIRVMLLDEETRFIRPPGTLRFELIPDRRQGHVMPVTVWQAGPEQLPRYWRPTHFMPGYAFQLQWSPQKQPQQQNYLMKITFWPLNGAGPITKSLLFRSMFKNRNVGVEAA